MQQDGFVGDELFVSIYLKQLSELRESKIIASSH